MIPIQQRPDVRPRVEAAINAVKTEMDKVRAAQMAYETQLAERALEMACAETEGRAWGRGGRAMKIGEIILIVDSDTLVPEDCLRDAAREMAECPHLAILQHESGQSHFVISHIE